MSCEPRANAVLVIEYEICWPSQRCVLSPKRRIRCASAHGSRSSLIAKCRLLIEIHCPNSLIVGTSASWHNSSALADYDAEARLGGDPGLNGLFDNDFCPHREPTP